MMGYVVWGILGDGFDMNSTDGHNLCNCSADLLCLEPNSRPRVLLCVRSTLRGCAGWVAGGWRALRNSGWSSNRPFPPPVAVGRMQGPVQCSFVLSTHCRESLLLIMFPLATVAAVPISTHSMKVLCTFWDFFQC